MIPNRDFEDAIKRLREIAEELGDEVLWGEAYAEEIDEVVDKLEKLLLYHRREDEP